jgi:glycosyltransferase involved in cell wall biosynthesis
LVKRKGIKHLIEAMPKILRAVPEAILVIVGDGPERDGLEEETRELKLNGNVAFLGKVAEEELLRLYYASDAFVLPAIVDSDGNTEGLGVVLLEAMSMKKPVVASRVGGIPEAVIHNETGFLVEPGNSEELASAVTRILLDHQSSVEMGEKGRQRVEQMFDWNIIAADFSELLTGKRHNLKGSVLISAKEGAVEACTEVLC